MLQVFRVASPAAIEGCLRRRRSLGMLRLWGVSFRAPHIATEARPATRTDEGEPPEPRDPKLFFPELQGIRLMCGQPLDVWEVPAGSLSFLTRLPAANCSTATSLRLSRVESSSATNVFFSSHHQHHKHHQHQIRRI